MDIDNDTLNETMIRKCIELAKRSQAKGNLPFGALLAQNGRILLEGQNTVTSLGDPLGHAELNLAREAQRVLNRDIVKSATLYLIAEPCLMCMGSIVISGITNIVYGLSSKSLGRYFKPAPIELKKIIPLLDGKFTTKGPYLEHEAMAFFDKYYIRI